MFYQIFVYSFTLRHKSTLGYIYTVNIALHNFHSTSCSLPFYIRINAQIAEEAYNNVTDVLQKCCSIVCVEFWVKKLKFVILPLNVLLVICSNESKCK